MHIGSATERPRSHVISIFRNKAAPAQKLQRDRTFKEHCEIREVARSFLRRARVRMPMPCRWRPSAGSDPKIRSALHSQKRHPKVQKRHPKVPYSVAMCEPRPAAQEASRCGIPPAMCRVENNRRPRLRAVLRLPAEARRAEAVENLDPQCEAAAQRFF